jgi:hypothetical protein
VRMAAAAVRDGVNAGLSGPALRFRSFQIFLSSRSNKGQRLFFFFDAWMPWTGSDARATPQCGDLELAAKITYFRKMLQFGKIPKTWGEIRRSWESLIWQVIGADCQFFLRE